MGRHVPLGNHEGKETTMDAIIYFTGILLVTVATGALAVALDWLMLRAMFRLVRPAGAGRPAPVRMTTMPAHR